MHRQIGNVDPPCFADASKALNGVPVGGQRPKDHLEDFTRKLTEAWQPSRQLCERDRWAVCWAREEARIKVSRKGLAGSEPSERIIRRGQLGPVHEAVTVVFIDKGPLACVSVPRMEVGRNASNP
jgi:hypothetical protein